MRLLSPTLFLFGPLVCHSTSRLQLQRPAHDFRGFSTAALLSTYFPRFSVTIHHSCERGPSLSSFFFLFYPSCLFFHFLFWPFALLYICFYIKFFFFFPVALALVLTVALCVLYTPIDHPLLECPIGSTWSQAMWTVFSSSSDLVGTGKDHLSLSPLPLA